MTGKLVLIGLGVFLAGATVLAGPPSRPLTLTAAQFEGLCDLQTQPEHATVLDVHATYKSEREQHLDAVRLSDDVFSAVWHGGVPGTILAILIAAAPL